MKHLTLTLIVALCGVALQFGVSLALDPAVYDISMQAGEDYRLQLQLKDSLGHGLNLTGYSFKAQFLQSPAPVGTVYATYSTVFSNMTSGVLHIKLSRFQTAANSGKSGVWDLRQTDSAGQVSYILRGKAAVQPTATR